MQAMSSLHGEVASTQAVAEETQHQTVTSMRHLKLDMDTVRSDVGTIKNEVNAIRETLKPPPYMPRSPGALKRNASVGSLGAGAVHLPPVEGGATAQ